MRNIVKEKLKNNESALGVFLSIGHPDISEIVGTIGFDWIAFDSEHGPIDVPIMQTLLQSMSFSDSAPIIRVPWNDVVMIKQALDIGAYGLVIPMVSTGEEAARAVKAMRYPPEGVRGFGPRSAAFRDKDYVATANKELLTILQIETAESLSNLDEIFSVEGVDVGLVGPNDLSLSMGIWRQYEDPRFIKAVEDILDACKRHNVSPGWAHVQSEKQLEELIGQGFRFLTLGDDCEVIEEGMKDILSRGRRLTDKRH